jgi:hypothetical protein
MTKKTTTFIILDINTTIVAINNHMTIIQIHRRINIINDVLLNGRSTCKYHHKAIEN